MKKLKIFLLGITMGFPGISGSAITVILGIYEELISFMNDLISFANSLLKFVTFRKSFKSLKKDLFHIDLEFGILLAISTILSILLSAHIMVAAMEHYPMGVYAIFFTLILASLKVPLDKIGIKTVKEKIIILITFIFFFLLFGITSNTPVKNPPFFRIFLGGLFGGSAILIPGLGSSFILLIFGIYEHMLTIIKDFSQLNISIQNIIDTLSLMLGMGIGFVLLAKTVNYLLDKHRNYLFSIITGLMGASLRILWPFVDTTSSDEFESMNKVMPWSIKSQDLIILSILMIVVFLTTKSLDKHEKEV